MSKPVTRDDLKKIAAELARTGYAPASDMASPGTLLIMIANIISEVIDDGGVLPLPSADSEQSR